MKNVKIIEMLKRKKIIISVIVGIIVIGGVAVVALPKNSRAESAIPIVQNSSISLTKQDIMNSISVTGTIASATSKSISVDLSQVTITNVYVQVGDLVEAGDVICEFDSSDIKESLASAKTSLSVTNTKTNMEIEAAQRSLENAKITRDIEAERASETVASTWSDYAEKLTEEEQALSEYNSAVSAKENTDNAYNNEIKNLSTYEASMNQSNQNFLDHLQTMKQNTDDEWSNTLSTVTIDSDLSTIDLSLITDPIDFSNQLNYLVTYQSQYVTDKIAYQNCSNKISELQKSSQTLEAEITAKKNAYEQAVSATKSAASTYTKSVQSQEDTIRNNDNTVINQENNVKTASLNAATSGTTEEEQVENYTTQLENCTVVAPFSGVITSISIEEDGTYSGGEICVIQDYENFVVEATVDQYDISDISKDLEAVVKTDTTEDLEMKGIVSFVSPVPEEGSSYGSSSTNYAIKIALQDASQRLRIGMTAKTSIVLENREQVFAVPYDCIETSKDGTSIIRVQEEANGETIQREIQVTVGLETDYYVEISSTELEEGMQVILPNQVTTNDSKTSTPSMIMGGEIPSGGMSGEMPSGGRGSSTGAMPGGF
ncbi:MAG: efflux RND transporter periplasmic adaptor subunit [Lachnospiraceae bacterium]